MVYRTALGSVTSQSGKLVIEYGPEATKFSLLEGEGLVRGGLLDLGGKVLHPGEQAIVQRGGSSEANNVVVTPIPDADRPALDERVYAACAARKTVYFDTSAGDGSEVTAVPVVPQNLPVPVTVSPAKLP